MPINCNTRQRRLTGAANRNPNDVKTIFYYWIFLIVGEPEFENCTTGQYLFL